MLHAEADDASSGTLGWVDFSSGGQPAKDERQEDAEAGIENHYAPVTCGRRGSASLQKAWEQAPTEGTSSSGERPGQGVPGEGRCPGFARDDVTERSLLNGEKWSDFITAGAYDADRAGDNEEKEVGCTRERDPGASHQQRADDESASTSEPVGGSGQQ